MSEIVEICIDKELPPERIEEAADRAITENPANAPIFTFRPGFGVDFGRRLSLAVVTGKRWSNGRTLQIGFLDGVAEVQERVQEVARQWTQYANLTFDFVSGADVARTGVDIRIGLQEGGSWSYIGTDALSVDADQPTINFGWLTPSSSPETYSRVVLHEFGHALGCIHEHNSPTAGVPWDKNAVYAYYSGPPNNWSREKIDYNLFHKYSGTVTQYSAFDPASIMIYPIPNQFTIGDFEVPLNARLSEIDRTFIGVMYPFDEKPVREIVVDAPIALEGSIGGHGEEDFYQFVAMRDATYTVHTHGPTDVVMGLFGPDSMADLVAEDDNSGRGFNARIARWLRAGTYYVRIRHFRPAGVGPYSIEVREKA